MQKTFKLILVLVFSVTFVALPARAKQQSTSPSPCTNCGNQNTGSQTQTQTQTQNQGEETQLQIQERTETELQKSKPLYSPEGSTSRTRTEAVGEAVENMVRLSFQLGNEELGQQIRAVTQQQLQSLDKTNQALDKTEERSAIARFFIGTNYNQLKIAKEEMEQNRLRIQELNRIKAQISNEGDKTELKNQIKILEEQNTSLSNQINDILSGFSLLGWLLKWISGYNS
jgi:hypothetical protein